MRCVRCGAELLPGKPFCHACGEPVRLACPRCSAAIHPEYRFCPDCGFDLAAAGIRPPASPVAGAGPAADPVAPTSAAVAAADAPPAAGARAAASGSASIEPLMLEARGVEGRLDRLARQIPESLAAKIRSTATASAGERKRATVMFCDLVGSTGIAAQLDPEDYRELLDEYLEICFREIYRYEGVVNQLAGDGMMALFGAPISHEDAPERAVRAALGIRDALARFNVEVPAARGFELRTRFGINTGPVVVGAVGNHLKMDYTAIGDTTNLAARLEGLAAPGSIVVSDTTARLIRGRFEMRALSPLEVKGKSEPVAAFEVVRALELEGPLGLPRSRGLTPLVGREEELKQLVACYERLPGRLPQVVAIVGEAGSGKSRILFELKQRLESLPHTILEARCSALSQMIPYAPWVAMMRECFGISLHDPPDEALAKVRRFLADLGDDLGEGIAGGPDAIAAKLAIMFHGGGDHDGELAEDEKRDTFEAMGCLVAALCRQKPLLVVFEDLHWIDDLSREMLERAVTTLRNYPMMFLVTHRPEYEPHWRATVAFTELHVRPLEDGDAIELVRSVAGGELPAELEARIVEKAEGSPLLLEEIARGLVEEGYLRRLDRRIELTRPVAEIRIPDTVQELISARIDRLGPQGKRLAQVAAVLGREFRRDQLVRLLAADGIDVVVQLDELERRGLLHRKTAVSEDVYRFGESAMQELAYASLLVRDRRQLHERIARLLEDEGGDMTTERSALLAHHYANSEDRARAVDALLRAARDAERLPSYNAALKLYQQAWDISSAQLGPDADDARRRRALDAAVGLSRIVMLYGSQDQIEDLVGTARRAAELAEALRDDAARAVLCLYEGMFEMSHGGESFERGLRRVERGVAIAHEAGHELIELSISRGLSWSYLFDGRFADALASVERVVGALAAMDDPERPSDLAFGARYMGQTMLFHWGRLDEAVAELGATNQLAARFNNRTIRSASAASLAQIAFLRAQYAEAVRWADEAVEIGERIGNAGALRPGAAIALGARLELGQPVSGARYLSLVDLGLSSAGILPLYVRIVVEVLIAAGDAKAAERCVEQAMLHSGGRLRELAALGARGELLLHLGSRHWREAERSLERAIALARETGALPGLAAALVTAGDLAGAMGDGRQARSLLEEALAVSRRLGLGRYQGRAERLLGGAGDRARASGV